MQLSNYQNLIHFGAHGKVQVPLDWQYKYSCYCCTRITIHTQRARVLSEMALHCFGCFKAHNSIRHRTHTERGPRAHRGTIIPRRTITTQYAILSSKNNSLKWQTLIWLSLRRKPAGKVELVVAWTDWSRMRVWAYTCAFEMISSKFISMSYLRLSTTAGMRYLAACR